MACNSKTLKGLINQCDSSRGGVKRIFIADRAADIKFTEAEGIVTAVTGGTWYEYYIKPNTSSFTSTATIDAANGVNYVETKLNLVFTRIDNVKRLEMNALLVSDVYVIVEDCNSVCHLLGYQEAVTATNATAESGTAKTDGNKYTLELTDTTDGFPVQVQASVLDTLNAGA